MAIQRWMRGATGLLVLAGLASCGGGGGGSTTTANGSTGDNNPVTQTFVETELGCQPDQSVTSALGRLHNNTWNLTSIGASPWRQCVAQRSDGTTVEPGWRWQWPDNHDGVLAYPSLVIGAKPWEAGPGNDARFPRSIASTRSLVLQYTVQTQSTGWNNLATSLWLTNTPTVSSPPDINAITGELMVWTRASGGDWNPGRTPDARITVDGVSWRAYVNRNHTDTSGGSTHRWTLVSYQSDTTTDQARLDLKVFLADAVSRGWLNGNDYIADVELGNEVASGSGSTWLRSVDLTVQ